MIGDKSKTRRLEYWKKENSKQWPHITYDIVPLTTINESFYFDEFVEYIKRAGFQFRIIETVEEIVIER